MQIQQENIRKGKLYFLKYSISVSQSSVDTIGKLELTQKVTL